MLDKGIEHGKEHRKQYYDSRAFDRSCRAHGGCLWCESNRKHKFRLPNEKKEIDDGLQQADTEAD